MFDEPYFCSSGKDKCETRPGVDWRDSVDDLEGKSMTAVTVFDVSDRDAATFMRPSIISCAETSSVLTIEDDTTDAESQGMAASELMDVRLSASMSVARPELCADDGMRDELRLGRRLAGGRDSRVSAA